MRSNFCDSHGEVTKGTWVRFYDGGSPTIGCVEYIWRDTIGDYYYGTDDGIVREDSVLEIRNKQ